MVAKMAGEFWAFILGAALGIGSVFIISKKETLAAIRVEAVAVVQKDKQEFESKSVDSLPYRPIFNTTSAADVTGPSNCASNPVAAWASLLACNLTGSANPDNGLREMGLQLDAVCIYRAGAVLQHLHLLDTIIQDKILRRLQPVVSRKEALINTVTGSNIPLPLRWSALASILELDPTDRDLATKLKHESLDMAGEERNAGTSLRNLEDLVQQNCPAFLSEIMQAQTKAAASSSPRELSVYLASLEKARAWYPTAVRELLRVLDVNDPAYKAWQLQLDSIPTK
jgi:hypothetical protein